MKAQLKKAGKEIKERVDPKTTPKFWRKVRNVAGIVASVGGLIISPIAPFTLPATAISWVSYITMISGVIAGRAHLTKEKK